VEGVGELRYESSVGGLGRWVLGRALGVALGWKFVIFGSKPIT